MGCHNFNEIRKHKIIFISVIKTMKRNSDKTVYLLLSSYHLVVKGE